MDRAKKKGIFVLLILLGLTVPAAVTNVGWSDWWQALTINLTEGRDLYQDEYFYSGPLYPLIIFLLRKSGLDIGNSAKGAGIISAIVFCISWYWLTVSYQSKRRYKRLNIGNRITEKILDKCFYICAAFLPITLFSTFLRVDDYHTLKFAGFNIYCIGILNMLDTEKIKISPRKCIREGFISGCGLALMLGARLHEGVMIIAITYQLHITTRKDKKNYTLFMLFNLCIGTFVALIVAGISIKAGIVSNPIFIIESLADGATAKLSSGGTGSIERIIMLTKDSYNAIHVWTISLTKVIFISITTYIIIEILRSQAFKNQLTKAAQVKIIEKYTKIANYFSHNINADVSQILLISTFLYYGFRLSKNIPTSSTLTGALIYILIGSLIIKPIANIIWNRHENNQHYPLTKISSYTEEIQYLLGLFMAPAVAGLASSGGAIDINYGLVYICPILYVCTHSKEKREWTQNNRLSIAYGYMIIPIALLISVTSLKNMGNYILKGWKWWGSERGGLIELEIPSRKRMEIIQKYLDTKKVKITIANKSFMDEAIELCSIITRNSANEISTVWSYPHPLPGIICKNTKPVKSTRFVNWYDVTGKISVQNEVVALNNNTPDFIIDYRINGAEESHINIFGKQKGSPIRELASYKDEKVMNDYRWVGSIQTRNGFMDIYKSLLFSERMRQQQRS